MAKVWVITTYDGLRDRGYVVGVKSSAFAVKSWAEANGFCVEDDPGREDILIGVGNNMGEFPPLSFSACLVEVDGDI